MTAFGQVTVAGPEESEHSLTREFKLSPSGHFLFESTSLSFSFIPLAIDVLINSKWDEIAISN